jgi:hypothetical protein|tara:strand:+ start:13286 stop:13423 length:138 start_codon:yes stop_codon:yes gene_type:complete
MLNLIFGDEHSYKKGLGSLIGFNIGILVLFLAAFLIAYLAGLPFN